jgi:hypothetical protein
MKVTLDFINANFIQNEINIQTKNYFVKNKFVLVNDYFNKNIGDIEIIEYIKNDKIKFACFFSKQTSNKKINNFYTTVNESKDFLVNRLYNEFFNV